MSMLDLIIIIPVLWGLYKGFTKGLVIEVASLLALGLGIWGAMHFYSYTSNIIQNNVKGFEQYLPVISYAVTFLAIVIGVHLLAKILDKLIKMIALGFVNRALGALFGGLKFLLFVSAFLVIIDKIDNKTNFLEKETKNNSVLYENVLNITYSIYPKLKEF